MIGKRVPGFDYHLWAPGDYGFWADGGHWVGITPLGYAANLSAHQVLEHEDGTITVSPSIRVSTRRQDKDLELWHGYLERGVWRSC